MRTHPLTGLIALKKAEIQQIQNEFIDSCERAAFRKTRNLPMPGKRSKAAWHRYFIEATQMQMQHGRKIQTIFREIDSLQQRIG
jgi:hypothetical protein